MFGNVNFQIKNRKEKGKQDIWKEPGRRQFRLGLHLRLLFCSFPGEASVRRHRGLMRRQTLLGSSSTTNPVSEGEEM
jgi:hypothetical protein